MDDEPDILEFLSYNLIKEGYGVHCAPDGNEALKLAIEVVPDLILLDVMMPEMDGIETCMELRKIKELQNTVIAFLTARSEDYSQIAGLDAGADDYIAKPIKPRVLLSRVNALLRRRKKLSAGPGINYHGLAIDIEKHLVTNKGVQLSLPKKEFDLLVLLISEPGRVFTRQEILNSVWGTEVVVGDRTIDVHIRKLREKLGEDLIKTVTGVGYKADLQ